MFTKSLEIKIVNDADEAPKYKNDTTLLTIRTVIIVGKGTENLRPTVDIQLYDKDGNKYVAMITGLILENLGDVIKGKREHDEKLVSLN